MATRERFLQATAELLESQGYQGTGLMEILDAGGAPRGSLYYHFPEGKEQLAAEAIEEAGNRLAEHVRQQLAVEEPLAQVVGRFVRRIASEVEAARFKTGGPLQTVALESATTNERLNEACRRGYRRLLAAVAERLQAEGCSAVEAASTAQFLVASVEGAILLSRTFHSADPLRQVAGQLEQYLEAKV